VPLQAMAGAIFDAILVHMMNTLAPASWMDLREDMCEKLNRKKNDRSVDILQTTYKAVDVQFLQVFPCLCGVSTSMRELRKRRRRRRRRRRRMW